jgi:hypothetical protein
VPDDGNANVFEIVSSELGQDLGVNLVLPERLLVALQTKPVQPNRDIHGVPHDAIIEISTLSDQGS